MDLLRDAQALLQEASVGGRDKAWTLGQAGKAVRINDVVRATLPASPPSRIRFRLDVPRGARLAIACGIPKDFFESPPVEFVVKAARGGHEQVLWRERVDPKAQEEHRRWRRADVDLAQVAGRGLDLILETNGSEQGAGEPRRAFWGSPALAVARDDQPLAIVYLVDTLRADHTTPYGYERDTTPELARFGADAVVFEAAIASASWTKPSVASIFTSLLPGRHRAVQLRDPLDLGLVTLAEMVQAKGFATGAALANSVIYSEGGNFEQGFDVFAGLHGAGNKPSKLVPAAGVVDAALAWLDERRGFPRFLYVHTMDPHVPYAPPPPFDRKYEPLPTPEHPAVDPRTDAKEPLDRERMIAQYDGDIAYGDQEFGRFVRELKARGLYDRALIVFLADHGEEFQDHGGWLHGRSVFDELVRIPLIVKLPGNRHAGRRVAQQVQAVDVLPTVLEALALPVPGPPAITGRPLQAVLRGGAPELPALSEISHRGFVAHGMRGERDKYVQRFSPEEDELYFDLARDPGEQANRIDEAGSRVRGCAEGSRRRWRRIPSATRCAWPVRANTGSAPHARLVRRRAGGPLGRAGALRWATGRRLELSAPPRRGPAARGELRRASAGRAGLAGGHADGRPLRPAEVAIAEIGCGPRRRCPSGCPTSSRRRARAAAATCSRRRATPPRRSGLADAARRPLLDFDAATCEKLRALGYVGNC